MSSRHPHALVRTSPDTPGRSRRDLPYTSFGHGKLQLLQQLELRLQRHSRHITAIIGRLRTHLQALEQLRRDAALPAADRRRVVRCQSQSQQLMQSIRMLDAAAAGAHSMRRDYAHNMDRDIRSVPESDVLELDNLVAEGEQLVLRLMANSPLHDYMPFIFDRAIVSAQRHAVAWTAEAADPAMPAADPMQPAGATPTRAPARAPRTAAAAHPRSGLSWMYGRVLALEAHVVQYGAVLTAQLRALTAARDHAEVRGGDLQESTSRILETWQAQAQQGSLLPGLRSLAEEMAEAVGRHERGELALGSGLVRQLERRAIALVFNVGQHVLASPLDANINFLARLASGGVPGDAVAPGCGPFGASAAGQDAPGGLGRYLDGGSNPSAQSMAGDFRRAVPIAGNPHLREMGTGAGPRIRFEAFMPQRTTSDDSNAMVAATFFAGLFAGLGVGGPVGAALADGLRPYDVICQGYRVTVLPTADAVVPSKVHYFYGWLRSATVMTAAAVDGQTDVRRMANLADRPQGVAWYTWHTGGTTTPRHWGGSQAWLQPPAPGLASLQDTCQMTHLLVQRMGEWHPSASMAGAAQPAIPSTAPSLAPLSA